MTDDPIKNKILLYLYELGPNMRGNLHQLAKEINMVPQELYINHARPLEEDGLIEIHDVNGVYANITDLGIEEVETNQI